jgi:phage shock protein PspC (stress-responsive transcriptional regulator)
MKEITRIHIAKTPYDIEVTAKKELEKYTTKLELYADDPNLLEDIEIRLTEILSSRGTEKDGVITEDDVKAIREQLGNPKDFIGDGDMAVGPDAFENDNKPPHRFYRDKDSAILGGVLSGIAKYFGVNPMWTRLIFIVAGFVSWGLIVIAYIVLWVVVPVAKTATEKLELAGKPVTLASIKELSEHAETPNNTQQIMQNIAINMAGAFAVISAFGVLLVTLWINGMLWLNDNENLGIHESLSVQSTAGLISIILFTLAGMLLTLLLSVISYAIFKKTWTKNLYISVVSIVIAGMVSFGGGIGTFIIGKQLDMASAHDSRSTEKVALSEDFSNIKELTVDVGTFDIGWGDMSAVHTEYIVSDNPRYEISAIYGTMTPSIKVDGSKAILTMTGKNDRRNRYTQPTLTIYGPALNNVTVKSGTVHYYNKDKQDTLTIITESSDKRTSNNHQTLVGGSFEATGRYGTVSLTAEFASGITLNRATVENLKADIRGGYVSAGVVRSLIVNQVDVCPSNNYSDQNRIVVQGVVTGKLAYNGLEQDAKTIDNNCGVLIIGDESEYDANQERY